MAEDQAWHASSCRSDRDVHSRSSKLTQASRETLQLFLKRTTSDGARAVPLGRSRLLGRGQWLLASRGGLRQTAGQGVWQSDPRAYAGACQLAQPGGDLLLAGSEEGPHAQRLRQLG